MTSREIAGNERGEFFYDDPPMERNQHEHPEQSYRRGYQQGADAVLDALRKAEVLDESTLRKLVRFVYGKVAHWRFNSPRRLKRHMRHDRAPTIELRKKKTSPPWFEESGEAVTRTMRARITSPERAMP
jgi:hypothetical protein